MLVVQVAFRVSTGEGSIVDRVRNDRGIALLAVVVGLGLIAIAVIYWVEPASALPGILPGHQAGSSHHHAKHGIAAFLVGVACLVFAWFRTAPPLTSARSR